MKTTAKIAWTPKAPAEPTPLERLDKAVALVLALQDVRHKEMPTGGRPPPTLAV